MQQKTKSNHLSKKVELSLYDDTLIELVNVWGYLSEQTQRQICLLIIIALPEHEVLNLFSIN